MMSEGQVRQLLRVLQEDLNAAKSPTQAIQFAGGVAALVMVLGETE
jgi:hypothetical protein